MLETACPKPARGSRVLAKEAKDRDALIEAIREKRRVIFRDGYRCRWPDAHKCRGGLEAAHLLDASLGGACVQNNLVTLCAWLHRRGPASVHGKQLRIQAETKDGTDGALSFWRQDKAGTFYYLVARECQPGVIEKD